MANDTTNNPHILDTTGTIYDATKRVRIAGVVYVGATTAGHRAVLTDINDKVIYDLIANGPDPVIPIGTYPNGLKLASLSSGKVYVYVTAVDAVVPTVPVVQNAQGQYA
jgi:hypothetical protein